MPTLSINDIVKLVSEAYPTGLGDVWDFENEIAKVGLIDSQKASLIQLIREEYQKNEFASDENKLKTIAKLLLEESIAIQCVCASLKFEVRKLQKGGGDE